MKQDNKDQVNTVPIPAPQHPRLDGTYTPEPVQRWMPSSPSGNGYYVDSRLIKGLGGWLFFWIVIFGLGGLTNMIALAEIFARNDFPFIKTTYSAITLATTIGCIITVFFIINRKKIGMITGTITLALMTFSVVWNIFMSNPSATTVAVTVSTLSVQIAASLLLVLYYFASKKVK